MINVLPPAMRVALQSAKIAVEFDKLTDDYVVSDACRRLVYKHNTLSDPLDQAAASRQSFLSETEYLEACRRWLQALKLFHPEDYPAWKRLYNKHWFGSSIPTRPFDERKEYDILLRSTARPVGSGEPVWNYSNLWLQSERVVGKRKTDALNNKTNALEAELADMKRWTASQVATTAAVANTAASSSRTTENNSSPKKSSSSQGFRGKDKEKSPFCYACGSNYHTAYHCDATKKVVGSRGDLYIRREGSEWVLTSARDDKKRFCYSWNLPGGCRGRGCTRGQHVCSLCGNSAHGAPSCSA
jgi:hypothetical protein